MKGLGQSIAEEVWGEAYHLTVEKAKEYYDKFARESMPVSGGGEG